MICIPHQIWWSDQIRVKKMDMQNFKRNCKRKMTFWKSRHISENDIRTDIKEIRCDHVDWIQVVQHILQRQVLVSMVIKLFRFYKYVNIFTGGVAVTVIRGLCFLKLVFCNVWQYLLALLLLHTYIIIIIIIVFCCCFIIVIVICICSCKFILMWPKFKVAY